MTLELFLIIFFSVWFCGIFPYGILIIMYHNYISNRDNKKGIFYKITEDDIQIPALLWPFHFLLVLMYCCVLLYKKFFKGH